MQKKYIIHGGEPLVGEVSISGAKNSALPILAATLLTEEKIILHNIPNLRDINTMIQLLENLGKKIIREKNTLILTHSKNGLVEAPYDIVKQMRASICVLGPLLAKQKQASIAFPGGCVLGPRPIDLHLKGLEQLGAKIENHHGYIEAKSDQLIGSRIDLLGEFGSSVLATDNVLSSATLAHGKTIIENAAREPETTDLIHFLNTLGAKIKGAGRSTLEVEGVERLHGGEFTIIQDRIEAGTFIVFTAITGGEVEIHYRFPEHLRSVFDLTKKIGINLQVQPDRLIVKARNSLKDYQAFTLSTLPYPHFPTDLQPLFSTLATLIKGNSSISEKIYPNRFSHLAELSRMGAVSHIEQNSAVIMGVDALEGAEVQASDLRSCAALVAAGLATSGETEVRRIYHGQRGYEDLEEKLVKLGASITTSHDQIY